MHNAQWYRPTVAEQKRRRRNPSTAPSAGCVESTEVLSMFANISLIVLLHVGVVIALDSSSRPVSPRPNLFSRQNVLVAGGVAAVGFKYYSDGSTFKENVDMTGKVVVITGGNTGLGKETAVKLAQLGATIYLLCRSVEKGNRAAEEVRDRAGNTADVSVLELDLGSLQSIEACSKELLRRVSSIDVLVNNAGVMAIPQRTLTKDGFESHFGINHLGHFAITSLLLDALKRGGKGKGARIVNVSSAAHLLGHLDFDNLMFQREDSYQPWPAYGNSKLANILFTKELSRRLQVAGSSIVATSCHPGGCRTELGRYIVDPDSIPKALFPLLGIVAAPLVYFTKSAEQGAQTQIFLSASEKLSQTDSGLYFDNSSPAKVSDEAANADEARRLWTVSEQLVGRQFGL